MRYLRLLSDENEALAKNEGCEGRSLEPELRIV